MIGSRRAVVGARVVALGVLLVVAPGAIAKGDDDPDKRAVARLDAMAKLLSKAKQLRVRIDCAWDTTQPTGEKIEFGETRVVTLRRPDRARVEVVHRDGSRRGLLFDGKEVAVVDLDRKVYATSPAKESVDAALDHLTADLQVRMPLRELLSSDLPKTLKPFRETTRWVAQEALGGVWTDHVSLRGDAVDLQLWIANQGDPLPRRIVITYRGDEGQPQFRADITEWNLAPDVSDSVFTFVPDGAEKIPFVVPGREGAR